MEFAKLVARVQAILTTPKTEWPSIASEPASVANLYKQYILVLAAVPAVVGFVKQSVIGTTVPFAGTVRVGFAAGLTSTVLTYVLLLVTIYLLALVTNALAPKFGGQKDLVQALKLVAYAYTASFVASVGQLIPWLGLLIVLIGGIYGIYLFYLGVPHTMRCPQQRAALYTTAVVIIAIVLGVVLGGLVGVMTGVGTLPPPGHNEARLEQDNGAIGKLERWSERMEAASKKLEAAQESGDAETQQEAMREMVGSVLGGQVETLPPNRLKSFLPDTLAGMNRSAFSAERQAAMGLQISDADATYVDGAGNSLKLEISDLGGANAIMAFASWAAFQHERETDNGYEKSYKQGERVLHERWNRETNSGEYSVLLARRFLVKVSGKTRDIEELKAAVDELSLSELESLGTEASRPN